MSAETHELSNLLLPELEAELGKTRRALEGISEEKSDFRPHQKSKESDQAGKSPGHGRRTGRHHPFLDKR